MHYEVVGIHLTPTPIGGFDHSGLFREPALKGLHQPKLCFAHLTIGAALQQLRCRHLSVVGDVDPRADHLLGSFGAVHEPT